MSGRQMESGFRAGQRVRLKSNPGRTGTLSGERIEHRGSTRWEVHFEDGSQFVPELALEPVTASASSPYALIRDLRFLRPRDLRAALTHCRLSGRLADMIYSLDTTNTDFLPYQFKPVLSFLDSPARGILIADEVGLGKTIEAGLIWTELRSREEARRLLVLCPAMLREKWKRELRDRFSVNAHICSAAEVLDHLRTASESPQAEFALIASLQGLRPSSGWDDDDGDTAPAGASGLARFLLDRADEDPLLDMVVIDEAHYLRNRETQTARLGRLIRPVTENLVLLSATPVQLRNTDLFNLLNLLDSDTFPFEWSFEAALAENAPIVALRDRLLKGTMSEQEYVDALQAASVARSFNRSELLDDLLKDAPSAPQLADPAIRLQLAERLDRANPISKVVSRTRKRDVQEKRIVRAPVTLRATMSAVEKHFYDDVTARVRDYCAGREEREGFMLTIPQRQMCSSMAAACRVWKDRATDLDLEIEEIVWEAFGDDAQGGGGGMKPLIAELARVAREAGDFAALRASDSKFRLLQEHLAEYWKRFPGAKVVLFAYFRGTLQYLRERFDEMGVRACLLMGGMDKDAVLTEFAVPDGPRLLLASEVASEGIDLQFSSIVVNYDLPWNPMRIEQRIGRIDRIGQKAERILIWNIVLADTLDDRVCTRLLDRLNVFEQALGAAEGILGEQVRSMSYELLRHRLLPAEEDQVIEQTRLALFNNATLQERLEEQASRLVAHGDYLQIKISAARELNRYVSADDLSTYVRDFVEHHFDGTQFVADGADGRQFEIDLGPVARADFAVFLEQERLQGRTRLAMPGSGRLVCRFENRLGAHQSGVEVISQYHPLVRWVGRRMRALERTRHAPVAALRVDAGLVQGALPGQYVFAVQRWTISGERTAERLVFAACRTGSQSSDGFLAADDAERLVTTASLKGEDWIDASGELDGAQLAALFADAVDSLDHRYREYVHRAETENRDRIGFQLELVERHARTTIEALQQQIAELRASRRTRTIRANEGRIRKARERAEDRSARLRARLNLTHESRLAAGGVIEVF